MIKNGKYFLPPDGERSDFKTLFKRLAAAGVGRRVDDKGFPQGPWTADLLTDAISEIDTNHSGIDLRTVQLWFQDNDKGISSENIRWLARIFGCDDPQATSEWQVELSSAQSRFVSKRRNKRKLAELRAPEAPQATPKTTAVDPENCHLRKSLALRSEALFRGPILNLPVAVWASCGVLWFLAYIIGAHSVTYSPVEGLDKQVGFFWSPAWTVGEMLLLPLALIFVVDLLAFWTGEGRIAFAPHDLEAPDGWERKVKSFSLSYWAILLVCFVGIFAIQWFGIYLIALVRESGDTAMVDWILVARERPDVISTPGTIAVSLLAFLYSGMIYWFYFIGLLLLFTISADFADVCRTRHLDEAQQRAVRRIGIVIAYEAFRCTVLGSLLAISIKLNAAYLISDAENIARWLMNDALAALGLTNSTWDWIHPNPSPFFTSFLLLFLTAFVFFSCSAQVFRAFRSCSTTQIMSHDLVLKRLWLKMIGIVAALIVAFVLIGKFPGFSIVLAVSVSLAISSLFWHKRLPTSASDRGRTVR